MRMSRLAAFPLLSNSELLRISFAAVLILPLAVSAKEEKKRSTKPVIEVGSNKQVFLDGFFLESSHNVHLRMHKPYRDGRILIKADRPWEKDPKGKGEKIGIYSSVLKEHDRVRLWYGSRRGEMDREIRVCYAESEDGLQFKKPELGLHEVDGSKANNVVLPGPRIGGCAVWKDPKAPEKHRYKTQTKVYPSGKLEMHSSPDGIHWNLYATPKIGHKDTQNIAFWDPHIERYLLFTRLWVTMEKKRQQPAREWHNAYRYRTVRRLESDDLRNWENEQIVMTPDERDWEVHDIPAPRPPVDFYGGGVFRYDEADRAYLMLVQATWHWVDWDKEGLGPATIDVQLAVSRDGKQFKRAGDRRAFLGLGPEGRFDSRFVWALPRPVRMGDELWIYNVGSNREHGPSREVDPTAGKQLSGITRAVLRLDGFVSVEAGYDGGQFTTPPLRFEGRRLQLNVDAAGGGSVQLELLDADGRPIKGFSREDAVPIVRNSVRMPVRWRGDEELGDLAGKPVRLRFHMTNADLYAFQFLP